MRRFPRPRLTFANVIACLALFIALGGTGYAAFKLPRHSVGNKQLKRNAVTSTKVKRGTLALSDINASAKGKLATNVVARVGPEVSVSTTTGPRSAEVNCKAGEQATGGGLFTDANSLVTMVASYPLPQDSSAPADLNNAPANGWRVEAYANTSSTTDYKIQAYVLCAG